MRVLLVQPESGYNIGFDKAALPEPLGLESVAGSIPEHDVRILDLRLEPDGTLVEVLTEFDPEVVAVTGLTTDVYSARRVLSLAKLHKSSITTVAGGLHATLMPQDFIESENYTDIVCLGDGEHVFPTLLDALPDGIAAVDNVIWRGSDGSLTGTKRAFSKTPWVKPRRDLTDKYRSRYHFYGTPVSAMATSRGCPCRCNFCSVWQFYGGRVQLLPPERVADEIAEIDCEYLGFVDDNFLVNERRDRAIADLIAARGLQRRYIIQSRTDCIVRDRDLVERWAEVGLHGVLLGLEGASNEMLQSVNKRNTLETNTKAIQILQDLDIIIWSAFIVDPQWDVDDFQRLTDYINEWELSPTQFTILTPLPGTDLYRDRYDELLTHDYRCYDAMHAVLPTKLPREEFYQQFAKLQNIRQLDKWQKWLSEGKVDTRTLKHGYATAKYLGDWRNYLEHDPVLGLH